MEERYDICVEYDALCKMEENLIKIQRNLENSTEKMKMALQECQVFLAGYQFEKAKETTLKCMIIAEKTTMNIQHAKKFICELRNALDEYNSCAYKEV